MSFSFTDPHTDVSDTYDSLTDRAMAMVRHPVLIGTATRVMSTTMSGLSKLGQSVRTITSGQTSTESTTNSRSVDTEEEFEVLTKEDFEK